jgi:plastocyanin
MPRRTRSLLALAALTAALTGCGSAGAPVRERSTDITITLDDYTIRPQTLYVPKGKRLTFTVVNKGRLGHTFRIRSRGDHNVLTMTTIKPGEQMTKRSKLAKGAYTMYCALSNHEELGMRGKLYVG